MIHYKIRSTREILTKIFERYLREICFCIDSRNRKSDGVCDIVAIPGSDRVEQIIRAHFIHIRIEHDPFTFNDKEPDYFRFETIGNRRLL